jgi:hypothetical protein
MRHIVIAMLGLAIPIAIAQAQPTQPIRAERRSIATASTRTVARCKP